jgi:DeoR/GlpR family transcriptional regulator of sugar metabolism
MARPLDPAIAARREKVLKLVNEGVDQKLIAERFGVRTGTISKDLAELRVAGRLPQEPRGRR